MRPLRFSSGLAAIGMLLFASEAWTGTFAIVGDGGVANANTMRIRDSILDSRIDEVILPGDNLYDLDETYASVWGGWLSRGLSFPIMALGNHTRGYDEELAYFGFESEYYSRKLAGSRFIVLNSDNQETVGEQMRFLDRELASARERFVFLVFHHPPFTITRRHGWKEREKFQRELRKRLHDHRSRITAMIVGHDHIASLIEVSGIPMIVSGATFETLKANPLDYVEDSFRVRTGWLFRGGHHWARLDIRERSSEAPYVWLNFVKPGNASVECSVRIAPRPLVYRDNCLKTKSKVVRLRRPPIVDERD